MQLSDETVGDVKVLVFGPCPPFPHQRNAKDAAPPLSPTGLVRVPPV